MQKNVVHEHFADYYLVTWQVSHYEGGVRLDQFLKSKYRKLSRERIKKAIKDGRVTVNEHVGKPSRILQPYDKVVLYKPKGDEPEVDFNFQIIYEDDDILVVDKPGNLPVHPSGRYFFNTLLTQLRVTNGNQIDEAKEYFICHRIDRETSGLLIMGKSSEMAGKLQNQFYENTVKKEYLAITRGRLEKNYYDINLPLARDPRHEITIKMHVVEFGADGTPLYLPENQVLQSRTEIQVIQHYGNYSLVRCKPETGRQHQIRIHLDSIGHPIAGDKLYGQKASVFLENIKKILTIEVEPGIFLTRHALHAHKISFDHPRTGERLQFQTELPFELQEFLQKVGPS